MACTSGNNPQGYTASCGGMCTWEASSPPTLDNSLVCGAANVCSGTEEATMWAFRDGNRYIMTLACDAVEANGSTSNDTFQSGVGADTVCLATGSDTAYTQSDSDILYVGGAISTYTADCGADGGLTNKSPPATNCTYDASVTCIGLAGWPARP